jgi:hypothetical protein
VDPDPHHLDADPTPHQSDANLCNNGKQTFYGFIVNLNGSIFSFNGSIGILCSL